MCSLLAGCRRGDPKRPGQPSVSVGLFGNQLDCDVRPPRCLRQVLKLPGHDRGAADTTVQDRLIQQGAQVGWIIPVQDGLPAGPGRELGLDVPVSIEPPGRQDRAGVLRCLQ